jgi:hypothetical protein
MKMRRCSVVLGFMWVAGCGGTGFDVSAGPMTGRVGAQTWTLGTAETGPFLSANSDTFFLQGYSDTVAACTGAGSGITGNRVIMNIPKAVGAYALSLDLTQTFYIQSSNLNLASTRGRIVVDEITDTTIRGGAHFEVDADNTVNGQFQATICP